MSGFCRKKVHLLDTDFASLSIYIYLSGMDILFCVRLPETFTSPQVGSVYKAFKTGVSAFKRGTQFPLLLIT